MSITIDELTTEVIAQPSAPAAGTAAPADGGAGDDPVTRQHQQAVALRLAHRLDAEGYDD